MRITPDASSRNAQPGGTAVVAHALHFPTLGVLHTADGMAAQVQREMLFMPLIKVGTDQEVTPWLAERWDTVRFSPDSLELTFRLRKDVTWHDGVPTTAEDVRFTFERIMDARTGAIPRRHFSHYSRRVEVPDPHTIRFRVRASGGFLHAWSNAPPLPRHLLEDVPPEQLATHEFGRRPTGNGPFRFHGRTPNQEWVFDANADFPFDLGGRPHLDRVVIRTIPEGSTRLTELLVGAVDVAHVLPSQVERVREATGIRLLDFPSTRWTAVFWNTRLPRFADARVRRALTMALDRQAIADAVLYGHGRAGLAPVTPFHSFFAGADPEATLPYDPTAARALLAEAGWSDNGDGLLRDDRGNPFGFVISVIAAADEHRDAAQIMQSQLRQIGVQVQVRAVEYNTLLQLAGPGETGSREFDALFMSVVGETRKDDSFLFHSRHLNGLGHFSGYTHPRLDHLLDELALSANHEHVFPLWLEYQRLLVRESPVTVLYYPRGLAGVADRLEGVDVDGRGILNGVARWRVVNE